jgi:hypothetical protein
MEPIPDDVLRYVLFPMLRAGTLARLRATARRLRDLVDAFPLTLADDELWLAMNRCCARGAAPAAAWLLERAAAARLRPAHGFFLARAAGSGAPELVACLLAAFDPPTYLLAAATKAAAAAGHADVVSALVARGTLGAYDAFKAACAGGHLLVAQRLTETSWLLSELIKIVLELLPAVAGGGHLAVAKWLWSFTGIDQIRAVYPAATLDSFIAQSLANAAGGGHVSMALWLLVEFNVTRSPQALGTMRAAAMRGRVAAATWLLDRYACSRGEHLAAMLPDAANLEIVRVLDDRFGLTADDFMRPWAQTLRSRPLEAACDKNRLDIVTWAFERFPALGRHTVEMFRVACRGGAFEVAEWLGGDLDALPVDSLQACTGGSLRLVQWVAERVRSRREFHTAINFVLQEACIRGHLAVAQWIRSEFGHATVADSILSEITSPDVLHWALTTFPPKRVAFDDDWFMLAVKHGDIELAALVRQKYCRSTDRHFYSRLLVGAILHAGLAMLAWICSELPLSHDDIQELIIGYTGAIKYASARPGAFEFLLRKFPPRTQKELRVVLGLLLTETANGEMVIWLKELGEALPSQ